MVPDAFENRQFAVADQARGALGHRDGDFTVIATPNEVHGDRQIGGFGLVRLVDHGDEHVSHHTRRCPIVGRPPTSPERLHPCVTEQADPVCEPGKSEPRRGAAGLRGAKQGHTCEHQAAERRHTGQLNGDPTSE